MEKHRQSHTKALTPVLEGGMGPLLKEIKIKLNNLSIDRNTLCSIQPLRIARLRGSAVSVIILTLRTARRCPEEDIFDFVAHCAADLAAYMDLVLRELRRHVDFCVS